MIAFRGIVPLWVSDYIACMLFVAGLSCAWHGMRSFFGRPVKLTATLIGILGIIPLGLLSDSNYHALTLSRELYIFAAAFAFFYMTAEEVERGRPGERLVAARYTWMVFLSFAVLHLLAMPFAIWIPIEIENQMPVSRWLFAMVILSTMHIIAAVFLGFEMKRERSQREIIRIANTDELTSLLNRRAFMREASGLLGRAGPRAMSLIVLDLDHFKKINDTYGHQTGDEVLRSFGSFLRSFSIRRVLVGRIGGEEFAVLAAGYNLTQAEALAYEICQGVRDLSVQTHARQLHFTVSIGVAEASRKGGRLDTLYAQADQALYEAKGSGRDRVVNYASMSPEVSFKEEAIVIPSKTA